MTISPSGWVFHATGIQVSEGERTRKPQRATRGRSLVEVRILIGDEKRQLLVSGCHGAWNDTLCDATARSRRPSPRISRLRYRITHLSLSNEQTLNDGLFLLRRLLFYQYRPQNIVKLGEMT